MRKPKMQFCFNCGEELGVYEAYHGDIQSCGQRECEREARDQEAAQESEARERAEEDQYGRYR